MARRQGESPNQFPSNISSEAAISREFSDYLLGEVKNYAAFYMRQEDFNKYIKFFQYLDGKPRLTMDEFRDAFGKFKGWANGEKFYATDYLRDAESLLQLLYDVNVIGYSEAVSNDGETFFHWSYRERSVNNVAPKVKTTGMLMLNPGISKALDIGKQVSNKGKVNIEKPRRFHVAHRNSKKQR